MKKEDEENFVKIFDEFYTNNHVQIMKSLLPFLGEKQRVNMPVLIKFLELQDAMQKQKKGCHPWDCVEVSPVKELTDFIPVYQSIQKYLSASENETIQQLLQLKSQMDNIKQMQQMFEMFQEMNGSEDNCPLDGEDSNMDIMKLMQFMKDFS